MEHGDCQSQVGISQFKSLNDINRTFFCYYYKIRAFLLL